MLSKFVDYLLKTWKGSFVVDTCYGCILGIMLV